MDIKEIEKAKIAPENLFAIAGIALLFVGVVFFRGDIGIFGNLVLLSVFFIILPRMFITFFKYQKVRMIEEIFPVFLQDLAEWQKSGLTLQEALKNASKTNYGRLTEEIKRIVTQISWGIPVQDALRNFAERFRDSEIIRKSVEIIIESYESGGNLQDTLEALAKDLGMLREIEKQRQVIMSQHIVTMYIIYFVFLGVSLGLLKTVLPLTTTMTMAGLEGESFFQDPCSPCQQAQAFECISCTVFLGIAKLFSLGSGGTGYYRGLFFSMLAVQGILSGIICGGIGEKSVKAGIKHSLVLTLLGLGVFMIVVRAGIV